MRGRKWMGIAAKIAVLVVIVGVVAGIRVVSDRVKEIEARSTIPEEPERWHATPPPQMTAEELSRVGWVWTEKASSFTKFETQKRDGVVRVGCFGGSWVYGEGVGERHDYASQLQALCRENGLDHVEVINFGNVWYGFQQAYLLWDSVGRRFDLDCLIVGPRTLGTQRDTTFNHSEDQINYTLHARFVLNGDALELIEIPGATLSERIDDYYSFVPSLRFLRYDRQAPLPMRCLWPRGRSPVNPFYYRDTEKLYDEAREIQRRLLTDMGESGVPILVLDDTGAVKPLVREIGKPNIFAIPIDIPDFPHRTQNDHASAVGNRFLAEQLFCVLRGTASCTARRIRTSNLEEASAPTGQLPFRSLGFYTDVSLEVAGRVTGNFAARRGRQTKAISRFRRSEVQALVALQSTESLLDSLFIPVDSNLRSGGQAVLRIKTGSKPIEIQLPPVRPLRPDLDVGVLDVRGILPESDRSFAEFPPYQLQGTYSADMAATGHKRREATLLIGDVAILRLKYAPTSVSITPLIEPSFVIRNDQDEALTDESLPSEGVCSLLLATPKGESFRVPIARWWTEGVPGPPVGLGVNILE